MYRLISLCLLILLAACTQPAASVDYEGQRIFSRNGSSAYSSTSSSTYSGASGGRGEFYDNSNTVDAAPAGGITVNEVAPPAPVQSNDLPPLSSNEPSSPAPVTTASNTTSSATADPPPQTDDGYSAYDEEMRASKAPFASSGPAVTDDAGSSSGEIAMAAPVERGTVSTSSSFIWPVSGEVVAGFGERPGGAFNDGINIAAADGTPIRAIADGEVVYAGNELKAYGNMLIVRHDNGFMSAYAHARLLRVKLKDRVKQNEIIAEVGSSGNVSSPQLHFSLREGKRAVDPLPYLAG